MVVDIHQGQEVAPVDIFAEYVISEEWRGDDCENKRLLHCDSCSVCQI
jgi:hypothetical protein